MIIIYILIAWGIAGVIAAALTNPPKNMWMFFLAFLLLGPIMWVSLMVYCIYQSQHE